MNLCKLSLAIVSIAALSPIVASASPEEVALNACAKAFASSMVSPGSDAPAFKVNYAQQQYLSPVSDFYARSYTFTMKANSKKTGTSLASATCSADTNGQVVAFTTNAPAGATLASR